MAPSISHNDIVHIKPIKGSKIKFGDILYINSNDEGLLAHRVIRKYRNNKKLMIITKGDKSSVPDIPISSENVLGIVSRIEKSTGEHIDFKSWHMWLRYKYKALISLFGSSVVIQLLKMIRTRFFGERTY